MKEYLPVLKDIEEGYKIILTDNDWYKRYYREIDDIFHLQFPWKCGQTLQPLEGAALYIGRGQIICSKQVPEIEENFLNFCHPYYQIKFSNCVKPTRREAKLVNHKYFHRL